MDGLKKAQLAYDNMVDDEQEEEEIEGDISNLEMMRDYLADLAYDAKRDREMEKQLESGRVKP